VLGVIIDSCSTHITLPLPMSEGTTGVEEEVRAGGGSLSSLSWRW
jgi:hypothetical protein